MKRLCGVLIICTYMSTIIAQQKEKPIVRAIRLAKELKKTQELQATTTTPEKPTTISKAPPIKTINQTLVTQLQQAVGSGNVAAVQQAISTIPKTEVEQYINAKDSAGNTLLHRSAQLGFADIIEFLLLNGAQTYPVNNIGQAALHRAATAQTAETLLNYGSSPFVIDTQYNTPLHIFAQQPNSSEIIQVLLRNGASPLAQNKQGNIPIMLAIDNKQLENIRILATYKESLSIANLQGFTAKTSVSDPRIKNIISPPLPPKKQPARAGG